MALQEKQQLPHEGEEEDEEVNNLWLWLFKAENLCYGNNKN